MSFGVILPNHVPITRPDSFRTLAQRAEELGYDHVWFGDHIVMATEDTTEYPDTADGASPFDPLQPVPEPLTTLAYLAACTKRIKLGPFVLIVPYREPIFTAKIIATMDYMTGGRIIVGVGVGWQEAEFKALGQDIFRERGKVTNEYIKIYKELWTQDDPQFQGKYSRFSGVKFYPKPVQKPHPPIWVGGHTPAAMRRAATLGDGWAPVGQMPYARLDPEELAVEIKRLRDMTEQAGRPRDAVDVAFSVCLFFGNSSGGPRRTLTGTADEIASDINRYQQVGVKHFVFAFGTNRQEFSPMENFFGGDVDEIGESLERFAKDVMPQVTAQP